MTAERTPACSLTTTQDLRETSLAEALFLDKALRDGLRCLRRARFTPAEGALTALEPLGTVELSERDDRMQHLLLSLGEDALVYASLAPQSGLVAVAGRDRAGVDRTAEDLVSALRREPARGEFVAVAVWNGSFGSVAQHRQVIAAPTWTEIRPNYAPATRASLDALMHARRPGAGGLVLWHGEPGTGKTTALRALAREWRSWCDVRFVVDPESFLGADSDYLLDAVMSGRERPRERWQMIVLEDAGELLAADARAVAGQALSRLLNLTDGLLGIGLRTLVLATTNEPLGRVHPAVARPGRCWMQTEFAKLAPDEANAWLERHGAGPTLDRPASIAELYALADGRLDAAPRPAVGFA